jgi:predicted DNA-binding protein
MSSIDNISEELTSLSQHVAQLPKNTPFSVPFGYFNHFHDRLMVAIQNEAPEQELLELSPLLNSLKNENPYSIPEGYFNKSNVEIPRKQVPVVGMHKLGSWVKYAAAACLVGILATVFIVSQNNGETQLAGLSKETDTLQNKVSHDAIAMYLEEMDNLSVAETTENEQLDSSTNLLVDMNSETIKEILQEIPDKDISLYIDQDGLEDVQSLN